MVPAVLSVGLAGAIALVVVFAAMTLTRSLWSGREHVGIAYGIFGLALVSLTIMMATWLNPVVGTVGSLLVIGGSIAVLVVARAWQHWRQALPLVLMTLGIVLFSLSVLYLWDTSTGAFSTAQARFSIGALPVDNAIPYLFSERLVAGESTHLLVGDWNGSDRPPLQAGFLLLVRSVATLIAGPTSGAFGASIIAQALWIPALFAVLRAGGFSKVSACLGVFMSAAAGTTLLNTVYTWPKLMSAALVLSSCVFLLDAIRRPRYFAHGFVAAVVAFAFAMLAHGAAAFAVPLVVALGALAWRGKEPRRVVAVTAAGLAAGLLVYLPWALYQRAADPPGDRLLKWHLAGVVDPTDTRSFAQTLVESYQRLGLDGWLKGRIENLGTVFDPNPLAGITCWCSADVPFRDSAEFYTTSTALGLAYPIAVVLLLVVGIRALSRRGLRFSGRRFLFATGASLACIILWCLLMFLPGSTVVHQGSQVWILLLLAIPVAFLAERHWMLAAATVVLQLAATAIFYLPSGRAAQLYPFAAAVGLVALAACIAAFRLVVPRSQRTLRALRSKGSVIRI